jgi:predicted RNA-binding Zn ribbon-like protein
VAVANPQPGGRAPAPGRLALVQAFINSNYDLEHDHGAELFDSPEGLRLWLARRGLIDDGGDFAAAVSRADLELALTVREGLRALLVARHGERDRDDVAIDALNESASRLQASVRLDPQAPPEFVTAERSARGAIGLVLALTAQAMLDGTWSRLKACRECRWAFYDHSRNAAGSWCSMAVCGGRVKQRAYYARRTRS